MSVCWMNDCHRHKGERGISWVDIFKLDDLRNQICSSNHIKVRKAITLLKKPSHRFFLLLVSGWANSEKALGCPHSFCITHSPSKDLWLRLTPEKSYRQASPISPPQGHFLPTESEWDQTHCCPLIKRELIRNDWQKSNQSFSKKATCFLSYFL